MIGPKATNRKGTSTQEEAPVIVLGVDTPIGVAIVRDLGRHGYCVIGIGRKKRAIGFYSRYCHRAVVRASSEKALITQLQDLAAKYGHASLVAISEGDLLVINRHRPELEQCLNVLCPSQAMLDNVLNKSRCLALAREVGIRIPDTFEPKTMEEVEQRAEQLTYPRVIKWSDPNEVTQDLSKAGLKLHKCEYAHDGRDLVEKLRPYSKINRFPLVQEYCPGKGIGQMFLVNNGEISLQFQHQRIHEWPPEGGVSSLCESLPLSEHQDCREKSIRLLQSLQWTGVAMVEYRYDSDTENYYFMEINGRFWGSLPLAIAAGVPFAAGLVGGMQSSDLTVGKSDYLKIYCRFMIPELRRIVRLLFQPGSIKDPYYRYNRAAELKAFFTYFLNPKTRYYLFSFSDPGPFFADIVNVVTKTIFRRR